MAKSRRGKNSAKNRKTAASDVSASTATSPAAATQTAARHSPAQPASPASGPTDVLFSVRKADLGPILRWLVFALFLFGLLLLNHAILKFFFIPVAWALILAYLTWPLYRRLLAILDGRTTLAALLMTFVLGAVFVLPLIWLITMVQADVPRAVRMIGEYLSQPQTDLAATLRKVPLIGSELERLLAQLPEDRQELRQMLLNGAKPLADDAARVLGGFGRNAVKFSLALITVFFVYKHGRDILTQTRQVLWRFMGKRGHAYLNAIADTSRAVMYGLVLTALAQGFLAGLGFWVAGIPAALLLGALTVLLALIPFGPPLIWVPAVLWLLLNQQWIAGIGLLVWGVFAISWIDNLVRPIVISGATRIPFLLVMFSVLGGVAAFGLLGLFVGPIAVAVLLAVWREWLGEHPEFTATSNSNHDRPGTRV